MKAFFHRWGAPAVALSLCALAMATAPAWADVSGRTVNVGPVDLAAVKVYPGAIDLAPKVRYEKAILTVSGMGMTYIREFENTSLPTLDVFDPEGQLLKDGVYSWELQLIPDARNAERLRASAEANGGVAERPWLPKSGSFAVLGGAIATPGLAEAGSRGPDTAARARSSRDHSHEGQQVTGQAWSAKAAGGAQALDNDEAVMAGGNEAGLLKATRSGERAVRDRSSRGVTRATGPDSDFQTQQRGASIEKALVQAIEVPPTAPHEHRRLTKAERSDGRPRSDQ